MRIAIFDFPIRSFWKLRLIALLSMWILFDFYIEANKRAHPWAGAATIRRTRFDFKEIAYHLTASIEIYTVISHRSVLPMHQ